MGVALDPAIVLRLAAAGCVAPELEAEALAAAAPDLATLGGWVARRERGEPLAWITRRVRFLGRSLAIARGVYVPRPHSEELARRAAARLPPGGRAADLCCGAGAIAAALPGAVGVDRSAPAADLTRHNGAHGVVGDVAAVPLRPGCFDVVTAVAPYVPSAMLRVLPADVLAYEPRVALDGGADGLDVVRLVVAAARRLLRPGGWLLVEVGAGQEHALDDDGFGPAERWSDEDGDLRGLAARRR